MNPDERVAVLNQIIETSTELSFAVGNERRTEVLRDELDRLCQAWLADD